VNVEKERLDSMRSVGVALANGADIAKHQSVTLMENESKVSIEFIYWGSP